MSHTSPLVPCAKAAWERNEHALFRWLLKKTGDEEVSRDLLQDVFVRVMQQRDRFCEVKNSRSWLFTVARNLLIDLVREHRVESVDDDIEDEETVYDAIDLLALSCLSRVLEELTPQERDLITQCDLHGVHQKEYAEQHGLSLSAVKSRLRRSREKLKRQMEISCQVQLDEDHRVCNFTARSQPV
ncbi:sigma-70 family RNA polymerase sigma factor [Alteromonas sp. 14N.309.X.WAT.G.H12]|uniref:sigma-70 family RNA polymerase sigma factor n=1 Tax=Alteromonas sp. 14N.309.X.WAT.G.H12 TaxID=3120824 RepID=UPI002FD230BB